MVFATALLLSRGTISAAEKRANEGGSTVGHTFDVTAFGAKGDGEASDTTAINQAVEACSGTGGGQVFVPAGRYLSGTIHLRSHVTLFLAAGSTLLGSTNLNDYQQPLVPSFMPEARWGKWHRGLLVGENIEDAGICGSGTIDGNKVFDSTGEEHMRGPHTIVLVNCRHFTLRDIAIKDSANYAIFFQASDDVDIHGIKITGGWDGVHFRGAPGHWCHNVNITDCRVYTGDDSIAGRYWDYVVVSGCVVNSSCNGIRLIGPAQRLVISNCLFYGPGLEPHRSSNRSNMLSGIILQPGAWDATEGPLDDVLIANNNMRRVASPVTIWTKPGNPVGHITIDGLNATGIYRSAFSVESWAEEPIGRVVLRNAQLEFDGGGKAEQGHEPVKGPGVDARPLPAWGVYARNVAQLALEDVRLSLAADDFRPVVKAEGVQRLDLENFNYPKVPGVKEAIVKGPLGDRVR